MMGRALRPQYFCRFGPMSAVMGLVFLSSCSILPKAEKLEIYQLPSSSIPRSAQAGSLPWALRIATPHSSQLTDSMRVLVLRQENQISAYKGIRWGNPAPVLLRDQLAEAFRTDGRFSSVSHSLTASIGFSAASIFAAILACCVSSSAVRSAGKSSSTSGAAKRLARGRACVKRLSPVM